MNQKLLHNLLQTWEKLAPSECYLSEIEEPTYSLGDEFCYEIGVIDGHLSWAFSAYLRQCIASRKEWYCTVKVETNETKEKRFYVTIWFDGTKIFIQEKTTELEALFTAYLTLLAMQRPVTEGMWQGFEGDVANVVGFALPGNILYPAKAIYNPTDSDFMSLEKDDSEKFRLFVHPVEPMRYSNVFTSEDYGSLVFYKDLDDRKWAQKTEIFLGLVADEDPESEGLLRFVQLKSK